MDHLSDWPGGCAFEVRETWQGRLLRWLLPDHGRPRPAESERRTYITTVIGVHLGAVDRLRVLVTGRLRVDVLTFTNVEVQVAESVSTVSAGR